MRYCIARLSGGGYFRFSSEQYGTKYRPFDFENSSTAFSHLVQIEIDKTLEDTKEEWRVVFNHLRSGLVEKRRKKMILGLQPLTETVQAEINTLNLAIKKDTFELNWYGSELLPQQDRVQQEISDLYSLRASR